MTISSDSQDFGAERPILVPVDFCSTSKEAAIFACRLAQEVDLPLLVLHVLHEVPPDHHVGYYRQHDMSSRVLPLKEVARNMVEDFLNDLEKADPSLAVLRSARRLVVPGLPAERIPEIAEREHAAMVIMGSCAPTRFSRLFDRSVAKEVARRCRVPVTVVKDSESAWWEVDGAAQQRGSGHWLAHAASSSPAA